MAWKLVNPNITNDPSYLDPRLSDDESKISSNTTSLAENTSQLKDIITVNAHSYGAKGDGTTIDTTAIQNAFTAVTNNQTFILPFGTYILDNRVFINATNCTFYFYGTFKMKDGITTPYGLVTISGSNNKFYNLTIDGNRANAIDNQSFGVTANLVMGNNISNCYFFNTTLINSMYSACVYNGYANNIVFDGGLWSNIGEHANYVEGGMNNEITYKNIICQNIGLQGASYDPNHEGYFIKARNTTYGSNSNFHVYNIHFNQTVAPNYGAYFMNLQDLTSCDIDTVFWSGMAQGFTGNAVTGVIRISNLDNTACDSTHGNIFMLNDMPTSDITIRDSRIGGYQSGLNICHKFHNCKIIVSSSSCPLVDVSSWTQYWDLVFEDCTFVFSTGIFNYPTVNQNVHFRNCDFISTSSTTNPNGSLQFGSTSFGAGYTIHFHGGTHNVPNFTYSIYILNGGNLRLSNFSYTNKHRGANYGTLYMLNVITSDLGIFTGTYGTLVAYNVFYNGVNHTEYKGQLTIPNGGTVSNSVNLQYLVLRAPTTADVILTPVGDTGGVRYYPTITGSTLTVTCNTATTSAVTFNVLVKTNS